jgi:dienelactone hydrolase
MLEEVIVPAQRQFRGVHFPFVIVLSCVLSCAAKPMPAARTVSLTAPDGTILKATYFAAAKPGPGVLLLHQCNEQRKSWDVLAERLASSGINVLTVDYRGFGESGGTPDDKLTPQERNKIVTEIWPGDIDVAFHYLMSQPGVNRDMIGAGGASCGVNQSIQLARRHSELKSLVLLSGGTGREGRLFLQSSKNLPVFTAAADDDPFGGGTEIMQWLFSVSPNAVSRFAHYVNGGHGADMFAAHKELPDVIAEWCAATLMNPPGSAPKTNGAPLGPQVLRTLELIDQPGGALRVAKMLEQARESDPKAALFSEIIVNLLGYEHIQHGDTRGAVEIMKLNATAYPNSPNAFDSLSDAYLADGQKDLALQNAKRALELLANDVTDNEQRRNAIRDSAERKLKQLHQPSR